MVRVAAQVVNGTMGILFVYEKLLFRRLVYPAAKTHRSDMAGQRDARWGCETFKRVESWTHPFSHFSIAVFARTRPCLVCESGGCQIPVRC